MNVLGNGLVLNGQLRAISFYKDLPEVDTEMAKTGLVPWNKIKNAVGDMMGTAFQSLLLCHCVLVKTKKRPHKPSIHPSVVYSSAT